MNNRDLKDQSRSIYPSLPSDSTQVSPKAHINDKLYIENLKLTQIINELNDKVHELTTLLAKSGEKAKRMEAELTIVREHALIIQKEYQRLKFKSKKIKKENDQYELQIKKLNQELREFRGFSQNQQISSAKQKPKIQKKARKIYYCDQQFDRSPTASSNRTDRVHSAYTNISNLQSPRTKKQFVPSQAFRTMAQSARLRLKASRIPIEQIINVDQLKFIFAKRNLSEEDLRNLFQSFPFQVRDRKLLEETVQICNTYCSKFSKSLSGEAIKLFLANALGSDKIASQIQQIRVLTNIHQKIYEVGKDIIRMLKFKATGKDFISFIQFRQILLKYDLAEQEVEFLVQKLILESLDLDHLNYMLLSDVLELCMQTSEI